MHARTPFRFSASPVALVSHAFCRFVCALLLCGFAVPLAAQNRDDKQTPETRKANERAESDARQNQSNAAESPAATVQQGSEIDDDKDIFINTDLVTFNVSVSDVYDRSVQGLKQEHFRILDNKIPQEIAMFSDEDAPVSLGVIFDVSGSMSGTKISNARDALKSFVETSHEADEYFLVGFNSRAQLLLDRTRDSDALLAKLTFVETKGNTALYDATYLGIEKVVRGVHPKKAVLLLSDGQDNNSRYTFREVQKLLKESGVIIYAIGILGGGSGTDDMRGQSYLEELAGVSGGKAFFPSSPMEMNDTFERIAIELRSQYAISYRPTNFTLDGKWHNVKVKVTPPRGMSRLFVRTREGYYATAGSK